MNNGLYIFLQFMFVLLSIALAGGILFALKRAYTSMGVEANQQKKMLLYAAGGLFFWLVFLAVLSFTGFFMDFQSLPPKLAVGVIPPIVIIIYLLFSKSFAEILQHIPMAWLVYAQSFRILVELFLWLGYIAAFIPFQMTFIGFNHDIIVGFTALMAGFVFFRKGKVRRFEAIIWNIFGIVLLLNIVLISALSTPSPFQVFTNQPHNTFIAEFPFIWLPAFIVPCALALHCFSLKQLIKYKM